MNLSQNNLFEKRAAKVFGQFLPKFFNKNPKNKSVWNAKKENKPT